MTVAPIKASTYLILEARRSSWQTRHPDTGLRPVDTVAVVAVRKGLPTLRRDQVAVRVQLEIPANLFDPPAPVATITVPADLGIRGPIEAVVVEPEEVS